MIHVKIVNIHKNNDKIQCHDRAIPPAENSKLYKKHYTNYYVIL